ncbi:MAG: TIGR01841 family phasin [Pseudolabrys sp.]|nr:TIGR01841 family phasin [Pseudolabrys sp.]
MAKNGTPNFEIPPEMRAMAEKGVEQAKVAFDTFVSAAQQAVSSAENQAATARTGAKEMSELAMRYAERNITSSFEFAQKLIHAKDPQDLTALHAEFVKNQIAALTEQAQEFSKTAGKTVEKAAKKAGQD